MRKLSQSIKIITGLCILMIGVHVFGIVTENAFGKYLGIIPRDVYSLPAILSAPFVHGDWAHLGSNLVALVVFSALILIRGDAYFYRTSLFIIVVTGILVWSFARQGIHIGASGWLFGLWSLAIARALFDKSLLNILLAMLVIFFYGGMVFGLLPNRPHISFEAHIFGAVAGVLCAYLKIGKRRN